MATSRVAIAGCGMGAQLGQVVLRHFFPDAETLGFVVRTMVGAEDHVHERRDVGVVAEIAVAVVVPMVQLGGSDQIRNGPIGKRTFEWM